MAAVAMLDEARATSPAPAAAVETSLSPAAGEPQASRAALLAAAEALDAWARTARDTASPPSKAFLVACRAFTDLDLLLLNTFGVRVAADSPPGALASVPDRDLAELLAATAASAAESALKQLEHTPREKQEWILKAREWADLARGLDPEHPHTHLALALACLQPPFSPAAGTLLGSQQRNFRAAEHHLLESARAALALLTGGETSSGSDSGDDDAADGGGGGGGGAPGARLALLRLRRARRLADAAALGLSEVQRKYDAALTELCASKVEARPAPLPGELRELIDGAAAVDILSVRPAAKVLKQVSERRLVELYTGGSAAGSVCGESEPATPARGASPPESEAEQPSEAATPSASCASLSGGGGKRRGRPPRAPQNPLLLKTTQQIVEDFPSLTHDNATLARARGLWRVLTLSGAPEFLTGAQHHRALSGGGSGGGGGSAAASTSAAAAAAGPVFRCVFWNVQSSLPTHPIREGLPAKIRTLASLADRPDMAGLCLAALVECPGSGVANVTQDKRLPALIAEALRGWECGEVGCGEESVGFVWDAEVLAAVGGPTAFPDACPRISRELSDRQVEELVLTPGAGPFAFQRPPALLLLRSRAFDCGGGGGRGEGTGPPCTRPAAAAALRPLGLIAVVAVHLKSVSGGYTARTRMELRRLGTDVLSWVRERVAQASHPAGDPSAAAAAACGVTVLLGGDFNLSVSGDAATSAGRHTHPGDAWGGLLSAGFRQLTAAGVSTNFGPPVSSADHSYDAALVLRDPPVLSEEKRGARDGVHAATAAILSEESFVFPAMEEELRDAKAVLDFIENRQGKAFAEVDAMAAALRRALQAQVKLRWGDHKPVVVELRLRAAAAAALAAGGGELVGSASERSGSAAASFSCVGEERRRRAEEWAAAGAAVLGDEEQQSSELGGSCSSSTVSAPAGAGDEAAETPLPPLLLSLGDGGAGGSGGLAVDLAARLANVWLGEAEASGAVSPDVVTMPES